MPENKNTQVVIDHNVFKKLNTVNEETDEARKEKRVKTSLKSFQRAVTKAKAGIKLRSS